MSFHIFNLTAMLSIFIKLQNTQHDIVLMLQVLHDPAVRALCAHRHPVLGRLLDQYRRHPCTGLFSLQSTQYICMSVIMITSVLMAF